MRLEFVESAGVRGKLARHRLPSALAPLLGRLYSAFEHRIIVLSKE